MCVLLSKLYSTVSDPSIPDVSGGTEIVPEAALQPVEIDDPSHDLSKILDMLDRDDHRIDYLAYAIMHTGM